MGIGKRILSVLIGILFIISVSVLGGSLLAKQVLVKAISQAGIDTAISHRMMDAVFGYAGADDTQWIAKIQNKIEKNEEVQKITEKVMDEMVNDLSKGTGYKDVDISKELNQLLEDSMKEIITESSPLPMRARFALARQRAPSPQPLPPSTSSIRAAASPIPSRATLRTACGPNSCSTTASTRPAWPTAGPTEAPRSLAPSSAAVLSPP